MSKDASLLGRLVEELDKAKKDLAEIRAKSGLPDDDAKPDLERLMEEEREDISFFSGCGETAYSGTAKRC